MIKTTYMGALRAVCLSLGQDHRYDTRAFLSRNGIQSETFFDWRTRIPTEVMAAAWEVGEHISGESLFWTDALRHTNTVNMCGLDMFMGSAPDIKTAIELYPSLLQLLHIGIDASTCYTATGDLLLTVTGRSTPAPTSAAGRAYLMGLNLKLLETAFGYPIGEIVADVGIRSIRETDTAWFTARLGRQMTANSVYSYIKFNAQALGLAPRSSNPLLFKRIELDMLRLLVNQGARIPYASLVSQLSTQTSKLSRIEELARFLMIDKAIIQRCLAEAGQTFGNLMDDAKKAEACRLLAKGTVGIKQIAEKCGYSSSPNFIRAFDRWFDCTPKAYQKSISKNG